MINHCRWIIAWIACCAVTSVAAQTYVTREAFLESVFAAEPQQGVLWLDEAMRRDAEAILGHPYRGMRVRYWRDAGRSAWIIDEIGKELPITVGVVTAAGQVEQVRVLAFRESRGGEVRYDFFTEQFIGAGLAPELDLDRPIDGITGATLSVWAVTHVTELALYLSSRIPGPVDILVERSAEKSKAGD